jgi:hypothetical protein
MEPLGCLDAVGYQELEGKKAMKADTIFQIMSMTASISSGADDPDGGGESRPERSSRKIFT